MFSDVTIPIQNNLILMAMPFWTGIIARRASLIACHSDHSHCLPLLKTRWLSQFNTENNWLQMLVTTNCACSQSQRTTIPVQNGVELSCNWWIDMTVLSYNQSNWPITLENHKFENLMSTLCQLTLALGEYSQTTDVTVWQKLLSFSLSINQKEYTCTSLVCVGAIIAQMYRYQQWSCYTHKNFNIFYIYFCNKSA